MTVERTIKRCLAMLAILVLLVPALAACGGQESGGGDTTAGGTTAPETGGTAPAPAGEGTTAAPAGETPLAAETPAAAVTAAGGTTPAAEGAGAQGAVACASQGGTAVVGIVQEPDVLDPNRTGMTFAVWALHALDVPMVRAGTQSGQLQPMLLTEVPTLENGGVSEDGLTYKITFKEGLKWSDGQAVTGRDFVFTHKTILDSGYAAGSTQGWDSIKNIKLSNNDLTATITLKEVFVPFLAEVVFGSGATSDGYLLPAHKFEGMTGEQIAKSDYGTPGKAGHVGTGPFKIESWKKGESITMVRNDNYVGQKACLDKLIWSVVPSVDAQTSALQRGDIDLSTNYYASDVPTLEKLEGQGVRTLAYPAFLVERYVFNFNDPKDPNTTVDPAKAKPHPIFGGEGGKAVRMAIAMAINRPAIVEKLLYNNAKIGITEWDNSPYFNKALKPYPFDPEGAKKMLDDAGWTPGEGGIREKGGVRLSFTHATTSGNPIREVIQRAAIADLRKVGIEMKIANVDASKLFATFGEGGVLSRRTFDIGGYTTGIGLDPDFSAYYATNQIPTKAKPGGSNYGGYSNPALDKLWAAQAKEIDPAKRQQIYNQIQQTIYDDVPVLYIYDRLQIDAAGPKLQTPPPDFTGYIWWSPESLSLKGGQ